jgi:hypothetical protein
MKHTLVILLSLIATTSLLHAQAPKYSNEFLAIGVGSQALGLGKAVSATTNDINKVIFNNGGTAWGFEFRSTTR